MIKVKICGITNVEDALNSIAACCDALGFVFYKKSPRYITPQKAGLIIKKLPAHIVKIGVFVNARENTVRKIATLCRLNMLQFHGEESPEFCARFKGYKIIKAFKVKNKISLDKILSYKPFAYLFDTFSAAKMGGTGKRFNWELIRHLEGIRRPIFLSGGLNERNVSKAIKEIRPDWVDACSSLECVPGNKDHIKVRRFVSLAKAKGRFSNQSKSVPSPGTL